MSYLLKAEFYKLFHSQYFWTIGLFNLLLSSVLLMDSMNKTANLFFASLYNTPLLYFLTIIFAALFVGNDFEQMTLQSYVNAGHGRGQVLCAKILAYQTACLGILLLPVFVHGLLGFLGWNEHLKAVNGNIMLLLTMVLAVIAMCMLPFFFAFLFRDMGKTLAVPMVLFFLMIFLLNSDQSQVISQLLPLGQLRLISLQQSPSLDVNFLFIDCLWIIGLYFSAYLGFRHSDLK